MTAASDAGRVVAWRNRLSDDRWWYSHGSTDPREVHDNGKEYEPLVPESLLAEADESERKAVQQLKEANRQLQSGVSIGGRQFYGTPDDIAWLQANHIALQAQVDAVKSVADSMEGRAANRGTLNHETVNRWVTEIRAAIGEAK